MLRVTAWMTRWLAALSCRDGSQREQQRACLDAEELAEAFTCWFRAAQAVTFRPELENIRASRALSSKSPLRKLAPIIDGKAVLRVGGRIKHSLLSKNQRHPIIIPEESHLAFLVMPPTDAPCMAEVKPRYPMSGSGSGFRRAVNWSAGSSTVVLRACDGERLLLSQL